MRQNLLWIRWELMGETESVVRWELTGETECVVGKVGADG